MTYFADTTKMTVEELASVAVFQVAVISDYVNSLETASSPEAFRDAVKGIKAQLVVLREQAVRQLPADQTEAA
jgi:hypothetical protein